MHVAPYLVFGSSVGAERKERGNSLGSSLTGGHVKAGGEWILKVSLIEGRQLPDELGQTEGFEVNDLADGALVVGILVEPVARAAAVNTQQLSRQRTRNTLGAPSSSRVTAQVTTQVYDRSTHAHAS